MTQEEHIAALKKSLQWAMNHLNIDGFRHETEVAAMPDEYYIAHRLAYGADPTKPPLQISRRKNRPNCF